jgi:branched-chain amino acid transport system permease protein
MTKGRIAAFVLGAAVVALLPLLVSDFRAFELAKVGMYFIAVVGLNILTGATGQISLGHGAFMAIGAYTTAILTVKHDWNDLLTIPAAGLVAGVAGFLFGFPALRFAGVYLALATFAIPVAVISLAKKFEGLTGGGGGLVMQLPHSELGFDLTTNRWSTSPGGSPGSSYSPRSWS